ncbi:hypothetical protein V6N13_053938 [Hibiscus sabdariffa]|uniref:Uncharacterized protein n=1 Tax=Hibiscus sabdariffa TaxID=183260 RepID=A0ABR2T640_9ROSI
MEKKSVISLEIAGAAEGEKSRILIKIEDFVDEEVWIDGESDNSDKSIQAIDDNSGASGNWSDVRNSLEMGEAMGFRFKGCMIKVIEHLAGLEEGIPKWD